MGLSVSLILRKQVQTKTDIKYFEIFMILFHDSDFEIKMNGNQQLIELGNCNI